MFALVCAAVALAGNHLNLPAEKQLLAEVIWLLQRIILTLLQHQLWTQGVLTNLDQLQWGTARTAD